MSDEERKFPQVTFESRRGISRFMQKDWPDRVKVDWHHPNGTFIEVGLTRTNPRESHWEGEAVGEVNGLYIGIHDRSCRGTDEPYVTCVCTNDPEDLIKFAHQLLAFAESPEVQDYYASQFRKAVASGQTP